MTDASLSWPSFFHAVIFGVRVQSCGKTLFVVGGSYRSFGVRSIKESLLRFCFIGLARLGVGRFSLSLA